MKYTEIKMYQAVRIGRQLETFISATNPDPFYSLQGVKLADLNGVGVLITTASDEYFVPYTNIAYAKVSKESNMAKAAEDATVEKAAKKIMKEQASLLKKLVD